jgi:hypothetical protein
MPSRSTTARSTSPSRPSTETHRGDRRRRLPPRRTTHRTGRPGRGPSPSYRAGAHPGIRRKRAGSRRPDVAQRRHSSRPSGRCRRSRLHRGRERSRPATGGRRRRAGRGNRGQPPQRRQESTGSSSLPPSRARPTLPWLDRVIDYAEIKRGVLAALEAAAWQDLVAHSRNPIEVPSVTCWTPGKRQVPSAQTWTPTGSSCSSHTSADWTGMSGNQGHGPRGALAHVSADPPGEWSRICPTIRSGGTLDSTSRVRSASQWDPSWHRHTGADVVPGFARARGFRRSLVGGRATERNAGVARRQYRETTVPAEPSAAVGYWKDRSRPPVFVVGRVTHTCTCPGTATYRGPGSANL